MYESAMESGFEGKVKRLRNVFEENLGTSKELEYIPCYVIHPKGRLRKYWNSMMVFILLYTATLMPYRIAFIDGIKYDVWWYIDMVMDIIFLVDFILNCFTATYANNGRLVTSCKLILLNYLKGWMLIDFCGFFPFDEIFETENKSKSYNNLVRLLRLPRLYRLLKISKIMKFFKPNGSTTRCGKFIEIFSAKESTLKLISFFSTVFTCAHLMTCLFYFAAKYNNFSPETWVVHFNYLDSTHGEQYLASMYWCYTTLSTVGYGDITPQTNIEIVLAILWMVFGIGFFSFTIGSLASMLSGVDTK